MKGLHMGSVGATRSRPSRRVRHHQVQAARLRNQAAKVDQQIIRLLHAKKRLLDQAAKLEAKDRVPGGVNMPTMTGDGAWLISDDGVSEIGG